MKSTLVTLAMALVAQCAFAAFGVTEINQDSITSTNGNFQITAPGSFQLTSNLDLTGYPMKSAITVLVDNVTIDLNGFAILGKSAGPYYGIYSAPRGGITVNNITVANGKISGFWVGIFGLDQDRVERVQVTNCLGRGIWLNFHAIVILSTVNNTTGKCSFAANCDGSGIFVNSGSLVTNNVANANTIGIFIANTSAPLASGGLAIGNVADFNRGFGLSFADNSSGYVSNTLGGNNNGGAQVSNGTQIGMNLCNGTLCKP